MKCNAEFGEYWPFIVIMPVDASKRAKYMLTLFSSSTSLEILNLFKWNGELCQKEIILTLSHHSNKTVISTLKKLVELRILSESTKVIQHNNRVVRMKCYTLTEIGRWYNLLFRDPRTLDRETLRRSVTELLTWLLNRFLAYGGELNIDIRKHVCGT
ncbi:MAG: hypothetical protein RMI45_00900 [Ignisphaera sp.]|nr:hypothetical protein [Ignisphaera sp.]